MLQNLKLVVLKYYTTCVSDSSMEAALGAGARALMLDIVSTAAFGARFSSLLALLVQKYKY